MERRAWRFIPRFEVGSTAKRVGAWEDDQHKPTAQPISQSLRPKVPITALPALSQLLAFGTKTLDQFSAFVAGGVKSSLPLWCVLLHVGVVEPHNAASQNETSM